MIRFTWAKRKASGFNSVESFELRNDGKVYAVVQKKCDGWFSYGLLGASFNTSCDPTDKISAMKDALSRVRKALEQPQ